MRRRRARSFRYSLHSHYVTTGWCRIGRCEGRSPNEGHSGSFPLVLGTGAPADLSRLRHASLPKPAYPTWSTRPGSNRRHSAWEADTLPSELLVRWSRRWDSNPRPSTWQADALPLRHSDMDREIGLEPTTLTLAMSRSGQLSYSRAGCGYRIRTDVTSV